MKKRILITGSTDGIGLETAKLLASQGHQVLLHGRSSAKLAGVEQQLASTFGRDLISGYVADLSIPADVDALVEAVSERYDHLDGVINNAGVFRTSQPITPDGLDVRFVVNAIAPYVLTQQLMPLLRPTARVVNLSSAAQSSVDLAAMAGEKQITDDFAAYAQSKLALTQWSRFLAQKIGAEGPAVIAVNPGSMLGSKMVREGFGVQGNDLAIGANILVRTVLEEEFGGASGRYYDNDLGDFAIPHNDVESSRKNEAVVQAIEAVVRRW